MSDRSARQMLIDAIARAARKSNIHIKVDMINSALPDWKQISELIEHPAIGGDYDVRFRIDLLRGAGKLPIDVFKPKK